MTAVAITGLGAVSPLGMGAQTLYERWAAGDCGIVDGEGACSEFTPAEHLPKKLARRSDRFTQLALVAAEEALEQSGLLDVGVDPERLGSVIGTGIGGIGTMEHYHRDLVEVGPEKVSPLAVPLMMGNAAAAAVALRHDLQGPCHGVVSACAAGAHAIADAARLLNTGAADVIVAGGAEAALTPLSKAAFGALEATSPTGECMPFDRRRNGFVMGEGGGALVLETKEHAEARGATIYGWVKGSGTTCDAHHLTAPDSEGKGAARAIRLALRDAGITPEDIDYINAHGTSTPLNDRAETLAMKLALGDRAKQIPISSTKSAIGHLLGAAGAVEAVATVLALRERTAPPTLGLSEPDEGLDLDYVPGAARKLTNGNGSMTALSSSFGFGGHNAVLVLEA